jgi:2,3-bisphosphoglycerate-dependent phosphoglycerate mutase
MIVSFIRHGSTSWNEQGRMQGRRDIPLSEAGRAQVRTWRIPADIATDTAEWVASPLRRTVETAELLCGSGFRLARALIEMDWGEWEGFRVEELRNRLGDAYTRNEASGLDFRPPGGESPREVLDRVRSWLRSAARGGAPLIVVTHLGVLRALLAAATGWDMTGKPPVRLQGECLHRFAVDDEGTISIVGCNVALVANSPMAS